MEIIPLVLAFAKSVIGVFFTVPWAVAINKKLLLLNSFRATIVVISSFAETARSPFIWEPRLVLAASGISWTLIQ